MVKEDQPKGRPSITTKYGFARLAAACFDFFALYAHRIVDCLCAFFLPFFLFRGLTHRLVRPKLKVLFLTLLGFHGGPTLPQCRIACRSKPGPL